MAIKCSLLGHSFGETTVEREREEQGSEVVITIREIETCDRCGEEKVVSENKEVTTLETPEDVEPSAEEPPAGSGADAEVDPDEPADPTEEEETPVVEAEPDSTAEADSDTDADDLDTDDHDADEPPVTDDAEILDDEDDGPERDPGEWPQESDDEPDYDEEDFDQYGYMDDTDDTIDDDATDAEFIDDEPDDEHDAEFIDDQPDQPEPQTNAWPSENEDTESEASPTGPGAVTVPEGEFVCEACGFRTPVESSSLRAGDFCPECHQETLVQVRDR